MAEERKVPAGTERFVLRRAAGACWLVDVVQEGAAYRAPIRLNGTGGLLWEGFCRGASEEEMAQALAGEGEVSPEEALEDVRTFFGELRRLL